MLARIIYRIKQAWFAMTARMNEEDRLYVHQHLNIKEAALFFSLPEYEQKHGVVVAKKMLAEAAGIHEINQKKLVRLGLLHDIGKSAVRMSIISKSILVVLHRLAPFAYEFLAKIGQNEKMPKTIKKFYVHKHHGAIGAELLSKIAEEKDIIEEVRIHDKPFPSHDIYMKLLDFADSTY